MMKLYNSRKEIESDFQYCADNQKYILKTNAFDTWGRNDSVTMLHESVEMPNGECSRLEMSVKIESFDESEYRATTGLMVRNELKDNSVEAFLGLRRRNVVLLYRARKDVLARASVINLTETHFPVELKMVVIGNFVNGYVRDAIDSDWKTVGSIEIETSKSVYCGIAGFSHEPSYSMTAVLSEYHCQVTNTPLLPIVAVEEDGEDLADDILFYENFEKGFISINPESKTSWTNVIQPNIVEIAEKNGKRNRVWYKNHMNGTHMVGNEKWADYSLSVDLQFTDSTNTSESNTVCFFVRQRELDLYGKFAYAVCLTNGDTVCIYKTLAGASYNYSTAAAKAELRYLTNLNTWNQIEIHAFDNIITVFWNGKEVLKFVDEGAIICPIGRIGLMTKEASVYLDNIVVQDLPDPMGGAYDNLIGGLWNEPEPEDFHYSYDDDGEDAVKAMRVFI